MWTPRNGETHRKNERTSTKQVQGTKPPGNSSGSLPNDHHPIREGIEQREGERP